MTACWANGYFATTRHGYKQMLIWMRSFGELLRVGVECTGTYGAGLLRYLQPSLKSGCSK